MFRTKLTILASLTVLLAGLAASGCGEQNCSDDSRPSLIVTVVDEDGNAIVGQDLSVEYQHESWDIWEDCYNGTRWDEPMFGIYPEWVCGREVKGKINIRASFSDMSGRTDGIRVKADECHVKTRHVELLLQ